MATCGHATGSAKPLLITPGESPAKIQPLNVDSCLCKAPGVMDCPGKLIEFTSEKWKILLEAALARNDARYSWLSPRLPQGSYHDRCLHQYTDVPGLAGTARDAVSGVASACVTTSRVSRSQSAKGFTGKCLYCLGDEHSKLNKKKSVHGKYEKLSSATEEKADKTVHSAALSVFLKDSCISLLCRRTMTPLCSEAGGELGSSRISTT